VKFTLIIPELDGVIDHNAESSFWGMNNTTYAMEAGDWGTNLSVPENTVSRSFLSFELPTLLENCILDSVILRMYQVHSVGNNSTSMFPFDDNDSVKCIVSHIDYGNYLSIEDFGKGDIGNQYTFSSNVGEITKAGMDSVSALYGERGFRYLNVTECVLFDYQTNRNLTQYRISFNQNTDYDDQNDWVSFSTSESSVNFRYPTLYFYYQENSAIQQNYLHKDIISVYPNPVKFNCNINFEAKRQEVYSLELFNIKGQKVKSMQNLISKRGENVFSFDTKNLSNGIYLLKMSNNAQITSKKITIIH